MEKLKTILIIILSSLLFIILITFNQKTTNFYSLKFDDFITYLLQLINIILMYYIYISFAKQFNKTQKRIQLFEANLDTLIILIDEKELKKSFSKDKVDTLNMKMRRIDNLIDRLSKMEEKIFKDRGIPYIQSEFDKYQDIIGENIGDIEQLNNQAKVLERILYNIEQKAESLKINIFN